MTYNLNYISKGSKDSYTLFDIEYYMNMTDSNEANKWSSKINCKPIVEGIAYFLKDKLNSNEFNLEAFIKDSNEIQEIDRQLYEKYDNVPKELDKAEFFHYHVFYQILDDLLKKFVNKYELVINVD